MEEAVRLMQQTLRAAPTVKKRAKTVYSQRNLGTIRDRKKEKKQEAPGSSGDMILRILRMRCALTSCLKRFILKYEIDQILRILLRNSTMLTSRRKEIKGGKSWIKKLGRVTASLSPTFPFCLRYQSGLKASIQWNISLVNTINSTENISYEHSETALFRMEVTDTNQL